MEMEIGAMANKEEKVEEMELADIKEIEKTVIAENPESPELSETEKPDSADVKSGNNKKSLEESEISMLSTNEGGGSKNELATNTSEGIPDPDNNPLVVEGISEFPTMPSNTEADLIRRLVSKSKKYCEDVETKALDYIAGELHHPVISCFRELKKTDFDLIFNQSQFKTNSNVLEQGITCIALMDYIATSLGNPLYSDYFSRNEYSIRPKVKKIFTELRRVLKDWAENDPKSFVSGKEMIIKFLSGLTPYFKSIQYDKTFASALTVLAKDAARVQRKNKLAHARIDQRSALIELIENVDEHKDSGKASPAEEDGDCGLNDDFFDFLDDVPRTAKPAPAPIFMKNRKSPYFKSTLMSRKIIPVNSSSSENDKQKASLVEQGTKRPASTDIFRGIAKKVCTGKSENESTVDNSDSKDCSGPFSNVKSIEVGSKSENINAPKEKVNAFVFLMNRSKELAQASKSKKQGSNKPNSTSFVKKAPVVHTVE